MFAGVVNQQVRRGVLRSSRVQGATTFTVSFNKRVQAVQAADGSWLVKVVPGLAIVDRTPVPVQRQVTNYGSGLATGWVDGCHILRGRSSWNPAGDAGIQALDFRYPLFDQTKQPTLPFTVQAGDRYVSAKSLDDPGTSTRRTCWQSAFIITFVDVLPVGTVYRPALFGPETSFAGAYISQFNVANFPALATPPLLDMNGNAYTFDIGFEPNKHYSAISAYGIERFSDVPPGYEGYQTTYDDYSDVSPATYYAYAFWQAPVLRFLRARLTGATTQQKQTAADELAQMTIDWHGYLRTERAAGVSMHSPNDPHGGHPPLRGISKMLGAYILDKCGATALAAEAYGLVTDNAPTIDGLSMMSDSSRMHYVTNKRLNSSNRSTSSWHGWQVTLGTALVAPTTEIHLGTTNFYTGASRSYYEGQTSSRVVREITGVTFKITERASVAVSEPQIYRIVNYEGVEASYNGVGGDRWKIVPSFTQAGVTPPTAGDKITFTISDEELAWCTEKYSGDLIGHVGVAAYGTPWLESYMDGRVKQSINDDYYALSVPPMGLGYVALHGLTSALWTGAAQTGISVLQTIKWTLERQRQIGYGKIKPCYEYMVQDLAGPTNQRATVYSLLRSYVHGDAGYRSGEYYLGCVQTPVLASSTGTQTGQTTASLSVVLSLSWTGNVYVVVSTSATKPSSVQMKAGQTHTGSAAPYAANVAVTAAGTKTFSATGLTAGTTYYAHFYHEDDDTPAHGSTVGTSASFTTAAAETKLVEFLFEQNLTNTGTATGVTMAGAVNSYTNLGAPRNYVGDMLTSNYILMNGLDANVFALSEWSISIDVKITGSAANYKVLFATNVANVMSIWGDTNGKFQFNLMLTGDAVDTAISTGNLYTDAAFHTVKISWVQSTGTMKIQVDGGTVVSKVHSGGTGISIKRNAGTEVLSGDYFGSGYAGQVDNIVITDKAIA
jgi:hypothetical protein